MSNDPVGRPDPRKIEEAKVVDERVKARKVEAAVNQHADADAANAVYDRLAERGVHVDR